MQFKKNHYYVPENDMAVNNNWNGWVIKCSKNHFDLTTDHCPMNGRRSGFCWDQGFKEFREATHSEIMKYLENDGPVRVEDCLIEIGKYEIY